MTNGLSIKELFEELLKQETWSKKPNVLYVTEITGCPRVKFKPSEYNFSFLVGTAVHELIQKKIVSNTIADRFGGTWETESSVVWNVGSYELRGRVDFLNKDRKVLIELKTGDFSFSHILQVRMYLNKYPDFTGYLVYLKKVNSAKISDAIKVMRFTKPLSTEEIEQLVNHYVSHAGPPTEEYCGGCYYAKGCKERGKSLFKTVWAF